jgi:hypothetical protein
MRYHAEVFITTDSTNILDSDAISSIVTYAIDSHYYACVAQAR